ncbi:MAG: hypothetical protein ACPL28_07330 [bacterium]
MELIFFFLFTQIDSNKVMFEIQVPFDAEAKVYEIDSSLAQKIEFFKVYPAIQKALLFLQPDSSYVIEIYFRKEGVINREKVDIKSEEISQIQQEIAVIRAKEIPEILYDRSGYANFLGNSFLLAFAAQAPLMIMTFNPDDERTGVAIYMLSSASGFVIPLIATKNSNVSKAHASMYITGGIHGLYVGGALSSIVDMDIVDGTGALLTAGGSVVGECLGFQSVNKFNLTMGRGNTIFLIGDFAGAIGTGLLSLFDNWSNPVFNHRHYLTTSIVCLGSGLFLGSVITRNMDLTDGDPSIFGNCGIVSGASIPVILSWFDNGDGRISGKMYVSAGIAGLGLGSLMGYRIVKQKDFTESEGNIITLGGIAGALTGAGFVFLSGSDNPKIYYTGLVVGDIIGAIATSSFLKAGKSEKHSQIHFHPEGIMSLGLCSLNKFPAKCQFLTFNF